MGGKRKLREKKTPFALRVTCRAQHIIIERDSVGYCLILPNEATKYEASSCLYIEVKFFIFNLESMFNSTIHSLTYSICSTKKSAFTIENEEMKKN